MPFGFLSGRHRLRGTSVREWKRLKNPPSRRLSHSHSTLHHDGLSNLRERALGTDPEKWDTDGDGYRDGIEVINGFDPLKYGK